MCKDLRRDIDSFTSDINSESQTSTTTPDFVAQQLRQVLQRVDDTIPWLQLALRTSDIEKGTRRATASSSRMLKAASVLQQTKDDRNVVEFDMRLYSMFLGNVRPNTARDFTWKEEYHRCKASLTKRSGSPYGYDLNLSEDINDLRYHEDDEKGGQLKFDLKSLHRMYYTKSGELLNIEDSKTPVLVLKIAKDKAKDRPEAEQPEGNKNGVSTLKTISSDEAHQASWYALEEWQDEDQDEEDEESLNEKKKDIQRDKMKFIPTLPILEASIRLAQLETTEEMDLLQAGDDLIDLYMN